MAHVRTHIRNWLKGALNGSAEAGDRVVVRRVLPLEKNFQPTFLIAVQGETAAESEMGGQQERTILVRVTACVKGDSENGENTLDAMCVFAERTFANDPSLGGHALEYQYQQTEFEFGGEGEKILCTAAMTFAVLVETSREDPETNN